MREKWIQFQNCYFYTDFNGYSETVFPDGTRVPAVPHDTDEYRNRARELGYGDDTAAMSREHEFLHTFLMEALGYPKSPTLYYVAHPDCRIPLNSQYEEEEMVLDFQKLMNLEALKNSIVVGDKFLKRFVNLAKERIR